jgi:tetrahydromethanopterin S-methyltransferase subunit B
MLNIAAIPFSLQNNTQYGVVIIRIIAALIAFAILVKVLRKVYSQ